jgi:Fic family protein
MTEGEQTMSRAAKGHEKYGKEGMQALAKAGREGASEKKLDSIRDQYDKYDESVTESKKYKSTPVLKESIETNEKKGIIATNRAIKPVFSTKFSTSINPLKYQF